MARTVREFERILRRTIREDIELIVNVDSSVGNIKADPSQLEQIIMNLAVNAQDAMPLGGKMILEVVDVDLDVDFASVHQDVAPGPHVMLAVSDTGVGMSKETESQIFEPFFTTKERGKGTGLGLSTVYGIVKQHGGSIWVYSEMNHGTTFKVYLPRVNEVADEGNSHDQPEIETGDETIMVVEDDDLVRSLITNMLLRCGYNVIGASDAMECLDIVDRYDGTIHLLLSDVVMPGMNGRELASCLKEEWSDLNVVFMSGYTDDVIARHGMLEEGVDLIQKPVSIRTLAGTVRSVLDRADGRTVGQADGR